MSSIAVLGAGYVGLTTAVCLSTLGHSVVVSDTSVERVQSLSRGECPILEDGLEELLLKGLSRSCIRFTSSNLDAVSDSDFIFLCLPTPEGEFGEADMRFVLGVIDEVRLFLRPGAIVITKSTVPIGASLTISERIGRADVFYVSNPEFLREGTAVRDFLQPDRIVIGSEHKEAALRVGELYSGVSMPIVYTDPVSAETIKYASNSFLAVKLSFVNGLASVCEVTGAKTEEVLRGMGMDSRIGSSYLRPGPGWGGSCFPKDTKALLATSKNRGFDFNFLSSAISANEEHLERIAHRIHSLLGVKSPNKSVALLGLTFKAGTDDLRDSPSTQVAHKLYQLGVSIRAYDPAVRDVATWGLADILTLCGTPQEAAHGVGALAVLTEWPEFNQLDPEMLGSVMTQKVIFDGRLFLSRDNWEMAGFEFFGVGRQ